MATVRALVSFHSPHGTVANGDEFDAKDPVVKGRESLFEPVEDEKPAKKAPARKPRRSAKKAAPK